METRAAYRYTMTLHTTGTMGKNRLIGINQRKVLPWGHTQVLKMKTQTVNSCNFKQLYAIDNFYISIFCKIHHSTKKIILLLILNDIDVAIDRGLIPSLEYFCNLFLCTCFQDRHRHHLHKPEKLSPCRPLRLLHNKIVHNANGRTCQLIKWAIWHFGK